MNPSPSEAEILLAEIQRLYDALQRIPVTGKPNGGRPSPAYVAIEQQIRSLADRYTALVEAES